MKPKVLIPVVIIVVVGTIVGLLGTQTWNPSWNPFQEAAENNIVEKAIAELLDLNTFKLQAKVEAEMQAVVEAKPQSFTVSINFDGLVDKSDIENLKTSNNINLALEAEGTEMTAGGEVRTFGNDIYLKLTTLPLFPLPIGGLEEIKNQWFKIDVEKLKEMAGETNVPFDEETQKELLRDLKQLGQGKEFFTIEEDLGEEQIDGEKTEHYLVSINKETLKELIPEYFEMLKKYVPEEEMDKYEEDLQETLEQFPQKIDEAWEKIGGINFDVWIEKKHSVLKKFQWEREIDLTSFEELRDKVGEGTIKILFELKFSDFNKKLEIEEPTEFKLLEELFSTAVPFMPVPVPEYTP